MTEPTGRRKLAAILMADVVEYGRHMGEDEAGTIRTLKAHLAVFSSHIQQRTGSNERTTTILRVGTDSINLLIKGRSN